MSTPHAKPYKIFVYWIDGDDKDFEVQSHAERAAGLTLVRNDRENSIIFIPYTNMKFYVVVIE